MSRRQAAAAGLALLVLALAGGLTAAWLGARRERVPSPAEISVLAARRQELQRRFQALAEETRALQPADAPAAGLLIGIPTEFTRDLAQQVLTGMFRQVTLRLRNLKLTKSDEVQARVLFSRRTVGQFVLDVTIPELVATLQLQKPRVTLARNRLGVGFQASLLAGRGIARVELQWDSRGVANAVCRDIHVARELHGSVVPRDYAVEGGFDVAAQGGAIVLRPRFGDVTLNVGVRPSTDAWVALDSIVEQQSGLCRAALRKADVKQKLQEMVERGFSVTLPKRMFRELRLPAGVRQALDVQGLQLTLSIKPVDLVVGPRRIWYGADVSTERRKAAS